MFAHIGRKKPGLHYSIWVTSIIIIIIIIIVVFVVVVIVFYLFI